VHPVRFDGRAQAYRRARRSTVPRAAVWPATRPGPTGNARRRTLDDGTLDDGTLDDGTLDGAPLDGTLDAAPGYQRECTCSLMLRS